MRSLSCEPWRFVNSDLSIVNNADTLDTWMGMSQELLSSNIPRVWFIQFMIRIAVIFWDMPRRGVLMDGSWIQRRWHAALFGLPSSLPKEAMSIDWKSGWWFGTFFIFPYIGNHHPNWLSYFSEGYVNHQPDTHWMRFKKAMLNFHEFPPLERHPSEILSGSVAG